MVLEIFALLVLAAVELAEAGVVVDVVLLLLCLETPILTDAVRAKRLSSISNNMRII